MVKKCLLDSLSVLFEVAARDDAASCRLACRQLRGGGVPLATPDKAALSPVPAGARVFSTFSQAQEHARCSAAHTVALAVLFGHTGNLRSQ